MDYLLQDYLLQMHFSYSYCNRLLQAKLASIAGMTITLLWVCCSSAIANFVVLPHSLSLVIDSSWQADEPAEIKLDPYLKYYDDSTGTLLHEELLAQPELFKSYADHHQDFKVRWLSLTIDSDINARWYLCLNAATVDYYIQTGEGSWISGRTGTHTKNTSEHQRLVAIPHITVNLARDMTTKVLLRTTPRAFTLETNGQMFRLNNCLVNRSRLYEFQIIHLLRGLPPMAILFTVFLYHLILYFYNRERTFLLLSLTALAYLLLRFFRDFYFNWIQPDFQGPSLDYGLPLAVWVTAVVHLFAISYLNLDYKRDPIGLVLLGSFLVATISTVYVLCIRFFSETLFHSTPKFFLSLFYGITLVNTMVLLTSGLVALWRNNPSAKYFVAATGLWSLEIIMNLLNGMGAIHLPHFLQTDSATALGHLMFSFGLAQNFKTLQIQRSEAEMARILADQNSLIQTQEAGRLKELDVIKSQLYTNVTHEFRTPLTVISGIANQLQGNQEEKKLIIRNADSLLNLVNQLLALSQVDAKQLRPQLMHIDVIPILSQLNDAYLKLCQGQKKEFRLEILEVSLWMDTDAQFLERIVNNLVHNALKFTPTHGRIILRVYRDKNHCYLELSDNGSGISDDEINRIFDRFYQGEHSISRSVQGTGIGLAVVHELVQLLEGKIEVSSRLNHGTTFLITLPIRSRAPVNSTPLSHFQEIDSISERRTQIQTGENDTTILIIEDHQDVRTYFYRLLHSRYRILETDNGKSGLEMAIQHIPDLIISDIMMPEMDGLHFCRQIKTDLRTSHIPVILVTAKSTQTDRLDGLREGADAYLVKPFDPEELYIRIEKLLQINDQLRLHYRRHEMLPKEQIQENRFLDNVKIELENNLGNESYQMDDLVQSMHLSRTQLHRKLKALTGKSFVQLITDMKMHRAKELLVKTDLSVAEISFQLGYRDDSYFSKVFKAAFGDSPGIFRSKAESR